LSLKRELRFIAIFSNISHFISFKKIHVPHVTYSNAIAKYKGYQSIKKEYAEIGSSN